MDHAGTQQLDPALPLAGGTAHAAALVTLHVHLAGRLGEGEVVRTEAGLGALAVAGYDHEIHVARRIDRTGQVGHEDVRALEDTDDQRILAAVILSDARAKLADLVSQLLLGEIYFLNIVSHVISHFVSSSQSLFPAARRFPAFG